MAEVGPLPEAEGFVEVMSDHAGDRLAALAWLRQRFRQTEKSDFLVSLWAVYLGDERLALDAMLRNPNTWALWHPLLSPVRDEADFREVVRRLGLEDYWRKFTWSEYCRPVSTVDFVCK
jgi:hypothetical protein